MLISGRKALAYLLVTALMATSISRIAVSAELAQSTVYEEMGDVVGHEHTQHYHDFHSDDIGTWACLKYCVEHAPDAGMIAKANLSGFVSSDKFGLLHESVSAIGSVFIETSHMILPRGPPYLNHLLAPQTRHDILLQTARFRI